MIPNPANSPPPIIEHKGPYPPRFWWLKRILLSLFLLLIGLILLRLAWGWYADRQLAALIATYRSRGEPVEKKDIAEKPIPDSENAAILLTQAEQAMTTSAEFHDLYMNVGFEHRPLASSAAKVLDEHLRINAAAFALVRHARRMGKAVFSDPLNDSGLLGDHVRLAAVRAHEHGDDEEAIEFIIDLLFMSRACDSHFVESTAFKAVSQLAPALNAPAGERAGARPASVRQVRALVDQLTTETAHQQAAVRVLQKVRMDHIQWVSTRADRIKSVYRPAPIGQLIAWAGRPAMVQQSVISAKHVTMLLALRSEPWPQVHKRISMTRPAEYSCFPLANKLLPFEPDFWFFLISERQELMDRRATALRLAIRLYQLEHENHLPLALGDLVPKYIRAVPDDPFGPLGRAVGYQPATTQPFLYSINQDGVDDIGSGKWAPTKWRDVEDYDVESAPDLAYSLRAQTPARPRSD